MWYKFEMNLKSMSQEQSGDIDARLRSSLEPSRAHYHMLIQLFGHPEQNLRSGVKAVFADGLLSINQFTSCSTWEVVRFKSLYHPDHIVAQSRAPIANH